MRDEDRHPDNSVDGDVHGTSVQARTIHGGVHLHLTGTVPPVAESGVRSLLRAQEQAAQELPHRLPGARRPTLAEVYVRQDLGSGIEEPADRRRPEPILDERGQVVEAHRGPMVRVTVRPPTRTVREALDGDEHLVVTGGPGQGKSTLSLRLAAMIAASRTGDTGDGPLTENVVPLRLTARELATRLGLPFHDALAESARAEYGAFLGPSFDARVLAGRVGGRRWLLLVDGLDEVADVAERDRLVRVLASWASEDGSPYRVVLTTRPIEGTTLAPLQRIGAARYELQPFDEEALRRFAESWFDDREHAGRFLRQLAAAHLDELVRVPLLATIAAVVFEQYDDRPLPDNQYELYEAYLRFLRTAHPMPDSPFTDRCDDLLEHLGRVRVESDTSLVAAAVNWAEHNIVCLAGNWREDLIGYLAAVGPLARRGGDLGFLHHSFAEHLAATAKARLLPERFDSEAPDFAHLLHAADAEEAGRHARAVLLHYTRLHPDQADTMVIWLHSGGRTQHLLAARLLAAHVPAKEEVVGEFLVTVCKWAMTRDLGEDILSQTSRATHHPGLADWLADLMTNTDAPWSSRIEAAMALATRLRGPHRDHAVTVLRTAVADEAVGLPERLAAAEGLTDCGGGERESAEAGLRAILADDNASGEMCRSAAVLLATFDGAARAHAVTTLTAMLDDSWSSDEEVVSAATGLAEISVDHHVRCAAAFWDVFPRAQSSEFTLKRVVFGLVTVGGDHVVDTVNALVRTAEDTSLAQSVRARHASLLARLGPQHRAEGRELLQRIATAPASDAGDRVAVASALIEHGLEQVGVVLLRSVIDDLFAQPYLRFRAASDLADLGPDYREEAAGALMRLVEDPDADGSWRMDGWERLGALGGDYRQSAIAALRSVLVDPVEDSATRVAAAKELAHGRLGVEVLDEVVEHLTTITQDDDPNVRLQALRGLRRLQTDSHASTVRALKALVGPEESSSWEAWRNFPLIGSVDIAADLGPAIESVVRDPDIAGSVRWAAIINLAMLGRRYRKQTVDAALHMFRDQMISPVTLGSLVASIGQYGSSARNQLITAFQEVAQNPDADESLLCEAVHVHAQFGHPPSSQLLDELQRRRRVLSFAHRLSPSGLRDLSRVFPEILDDILAGDTIASHHWKRLMVNFHPGSVTPVLRDVLSGKDNTRARRESTAALLARLTEPIDSAAVAELRRQADDDCLDAESRADAVVQLAALTSKTADVVRYFRAVFHDQASPIHDRCKAGYLLVRLDPRRAEQVFRLMKTWATKGPIMDRSVVPYWLRRANVQLTKIGHMAMAIASDPSADSATREYVQQWVTARNRRTIERSLLEDRTATPAQRTGHVSAWQSSTLAAEAESVLRDIIAADETSASHRLEAALELARMSRANIAETAAVLTSFLTHPTLGNRARGELAKLGHTRKEQVLADAHAVLHDLDAPWRARRDAAALIIDVTRRLPEDVADCLRSLLAENQPSARNRVDILWMLRRRDGLDPVRRIRDDEQHAPQTRRKAANRLRDFAVEDRAAAVRLLHAIAADPRCRPTLRWRAAKDLLELGVRGREVGAPILLSLAHDEAIPEGVRIDAARHLGTHRPDLRHEVLASLRSLTGAEHPRTRVRAWAAIGLFREDEAALGLRTMARDPGIDAGARLRAGRKMIDYNREFREAAAVVARGIAHDPACPRHIRHKAARLLAQLSDLCRPEAQALLRELVSGWS